MKKLLTLSFLLLSSLFSHAQWTMTFADYPVIGNTQYYTLADTSADEGPTGAGQSWDFSGLTPKTTHRTVSWVTPASLPSGTCCPAANISFSDNAGNFAHYETVGTDSVLLRGERSISGSPIPYANPPKVREFPFNLGDSYTDSLNSVYFDGFVYNATRWGVITTTYDASGTLKTPFATYSDVLRVHTSWTTFDSSHSSLVDSYAWVELYEWYENGKPLPVFSIRDQVVITNGTAPSVAKEVLYADSMVVGAEPAMFVGTGLSLYPNPSTGLVYLAFDLDGASPAVAEVYDLMGRLVFANPLGALSAGHHSVKLDLAGLKAGAYIVNVKCGDKTLRARMIAE